MKNTELWDKFKETDPRYTKSFKRGGGFSGTATDPMYIIMRMTQEFGANGIGWGWEILDEAYVEGAPLKKDPTMKTLIHKIQLRLWYMVGEERNLGSPQFGLTTFVGEYTTAGIYTDEEHAKKSVTDALSKCAVQLGIAADIHMGKYDDNKYVKSLHDKYDGNKPLPDYATLKDNSEADIDDIPMGDMPDSKLISEAQRKRLFAISKQYDWKDSAVKSLIAKHGFDSSRAITKGDKYKAIVDELEHGME